MTNHAAAAPAVNIHHHRTVGAHVPNVPALPNCRLLIEPVEVDLGVSVDLNRKIEDTLTQQVVEKVRSLAQVQWTIGKRDLDHHLR